MADNAADTVRDGRFTWTRGEKNGRAKITAAQADEIRIAYRTAVRRVRGNRGEEIGARYGISESMVRKIV